LWVLIAVQLHVRRSYGIVMADRLPEDTARLPYCLLSLPGMSNLLNPGQYQ